ARDVAPECVIAVEPGLLTSVADLQPVLIRGTTLDRSRVAPERIAEQPDAFVAATLDAEIHRRSVRAARVEHIAPGPRDRIGQEPMQVGPACDAVDLRV